MDKIKIFIATDDAIFQEGLNQFLQDEEDLECLAKPTTGEDTIRLAKVLRAAARGVSNKEIGSELGISERTVQTHLVNISRKLDVNSRTEAVLRALKEGWLELDDLP